MPAPLASKTAPALEGELRVLAAASLTMALTAIAERFEQANPRVKVHLSLRLLDDLHERQVEAGAPCDLYIAAAQANVDRLAAASLVDSASRTVIAHNELVVIVPKGALLPADAASLHVYPRVAVGARGVPVGGYAREALRGVLDESHLAGYPDEPSVVTPSRRERRPRASATRRASRATRAARDVERALALPTTTPIEYPAVVPGAAKAPELARAFLAFARSAPGREELAKGGFRE